MCSSDLNSTPVEVTVPRQSLGQLGGKQSLEVSTENSVMPNLQGLDPRSALQLLEQWGIEVELIGKGKVTQQSIKPGTELQTIAKVTLKLS